ncbi:PREDICTED: uncharacterized protein LOC107358070 [Acropora digitifera]|uniref:uncharacterized protein LOC107358070 n=1 Tax=Acropora digitifera TaxID=70779 RepID=UPI00077A360E|nr:PREDICTED: uncharacterized protein LOC107358070 [Acropora digitifera]
MKMEPCEKRPKLGQESVCQSSSKESSVVGRNLEENNNYIENAGNIVLNTKLPVCEEGANCNRTDLIHFAEFWHPTKTHEKENQCLEENECEVIELAGQDWEATQEVCEEEYSSSESEEGQDYNSNTIRKNKQQHSESNSLDSQLSRDDTIFSRGPSIVKCYSFLSETERRELIRRAFEMKDLLKKELDKTLEIIEEKNKELRRVHSRLERGHLMIEGEKEALDKDDLCFFPLYAEREYKEGSAAQMHFRLAESQFYRLVDTTDKYRVVKVEYVVNPVLIRRFQNARQKLKNVRGDKMSYPVLAFHGTKEENIHSICNTGFRVPGEANFVHATDTGNYGRGVYFSEYPSYSMAFIRGASRLLLCQVLPGKVYRCSKLIHGEPLEIGHDCHTSPDGKELVIFNSHHILPSYVVHYGEATGDFTYETTKA